MKTKTILFACLFLSIAMTKLSAQTGAVITRLDLTWGLENPVYCDGKQGEVDRLLMDYFTYFAVNVYKDGVLLRTNNWLEGQAHSVNTGEIFTYKEVDHSIGTETTYNAKFNLIGNLGNHYIQSFVIEFADAEYILHPTVIKALCLTNGKK